jgi:SAM-dependent methyltransferase
LSLPFNLPIPQGHIDHPHWDGLNFILGNKCISVLEYSENFAGWSDDLSLLHQDAVGSSHPIDIASRNDALTQIKKINLSNRSVIMEIGCSSGYFIKDLLTTFNDSIVVGVDVIKKPLFELARTLPGVPLIRFDLLKCPLPDKSVDVLIMLNVLEHIEDDLEALKNAFKLLKPGGFLIIEVPAGRFLYDSYDAELHHFRRYSSKELTCKLVNTGFTLVRKSHLGFLIFPAFVLVKLLNKIISHFKRHNSQIVRDQAVASSKSKLLSWIMNFESNYLGNFSLPFGIRVLTVACKPK